MEGPAHDFPCFRNRFDGFAKHLPDDCVEYTLFIINSQLKSQRELLARLEAVRKEATRLTENLLKDYIWQREAFNLDLESNQGRIYLHGLTNYGDSIEDEWLIVYILRELSNLFQDLWVKVVDTDGEFLLIEAANALPRWLNPEIADNRVWIHDNKLRIIPLITASQSPKTLPAALVSRSLGQEKAIEIIKSTPEILMHSPLIEAEAFYRLQHYPLQISACLHHSLVKIPRKLAYILHKRPAAISPAVEAFYLRDPVALKPLQAKSDSLIFPPDDLIIVSARFTKVLFAQIKSQEFSPPAAWKDVLPVSEKAENFSNEHLSLGMKLTSGFEMLLRDLKHKDNRIVRELRLILDDLETDDEIILPSDAEISKWDNVCREDNESWMDINFQDFDQELAGNSGCKAPGISGSAPLSGFGDAKTQTDLKKIVERFESFLNNENSGLDGAEVDEMEFDEEEKESEDDSEDEDKDINFNEREFSRMLREMMGMSSEEAVGAHGGPKTGIPFGNVEGVEIDDVQSEFDEAEEVKTVMDKIGVELNEASFLNHDPTSSNPGALKHETAKEDDHNSDQDVNIDFNLAKNLLESFKSQAGMAGPGGNVLRMMGMQLPRDEDDVNSQLKIT